MGYCEKPIISKRMVIHRYDNVQRNGDLFYMNAV